MSESPDPHIWTRADLAWRDRYFPGTEIGDRREIATATYEVLKVRGEVRSHRVLSYRCRARRCLLLDVLRVPQGLLVYVPPRKYSPARNRPAPESVLERWTTDGDRHWTGVGAFARDMYLLALACDHAITSMPTRARVEADVAAGVGEVLWPDTSAVLT